MNKIQNTKHKQTNKKRPEHKNPFPPEKIPSICILLQRRRQATKTWSGYICWKYRPPREHCNTKASEALRVSNTKDLGWTKSLTTPLKLDVWRSSQSEASFQHYLIFISCLYGDIMKSLADGLFPFLEIWFVFRHHLFYFAVHNRVWSYVSPHMAFYERYGLAIQYFRDFFKSKTMETINHKDSGIWSVLRSQVYRYRLGILKWPFKVDLRSVNSVRSNIGIHFYLNKTTIKQ